MQFFSVFLRTLGFFTAIAVFFILINLIFILTPRTNDNFKLVQGDKNSDNSIAILDLNGPILNGLDQSIVSNVINYINPSYVKEQLLKIEKINPKFLIIKINSPGGTVSATASLEKLISEFKKENKISIYFYSDDILASGGYWVATSGDKIYSNYGSIIGSIGVSGPSWYYFDEPKSISNGIFGRNIEANNGIKIFDQNAGYSKDLYNPFRKPTKKELDHLQNIVESIYDDFVNKVSKSRKIEIATIKNDIGALIYTSKQAEENFLLDGVIDFDNLLIKIVNENNLKDYKILRLKIKNNFFKQYLLNFLNVNFEIVCTKLNSNFVSILPLYSKSC